jgi:DNA-binding NarL/FixJ family response regulator
MAVRQTLRLHLECLAVIVTAEAATTSQALNLLRASRPDLVLLDASIGDVPYRDTLALLRDIHVHSPTTEVVVVANKNAQDTAMSLVKAGARDFVIDPADDASFELLWQGLSTMYPNLRKSAE